MPYSDNTKIAEHIRFGGFELADTQKRMLNNRVPVTYSKDVVDRAQTAAASHLKSLDYDTLHLEGNCLIARKKRENKLETEVGDIRVSFFKVPCGPTSIIAQQV